MSNARKKRGGKGREGKGWRDETRRLSARD